MITCNADTFWSYVADLRLNPPVKLLRGIPVEALQVHSNTKSHWSSGPTVCFPPRGQQFVSWRCTHTYSIMGSPVSDVLLNAPVFPEEALYEYIQNKGYTSMHVFTLALIVMEYQSISLYSLNPRQKPTDTSTRQSCTTHTCTLSKYPWLYCIASPGTNPGYLSSSPVPKNIL